MLQAHREWQERERVTAANVWEDHDLVFAQPNGRPVDPRDDWEEWKTLLKLAGVADARVHDGRHTAGTSRALTSGWFRRSWAIPIYE